MKKSAFLFVWALLLTHSVAWACCAESNYRLFPIGELDQQIVFIEFDFSRNCDMEPGKEEGFTFFLVGRINLRISQADSLALLTNIDTIYVEECVCSYKTFYEKSAYDSLFAQQYQTALTQAKQMKGFQVAKTSSIIFNDTANTITSEIVTDSSYSRPFAYKDMLDMDLAELEVLSCYPDKVAEVRVYETPNFEITVVRLRCYLIKDERLAERKERFASIETAFWKETAQWHGIARDYYLIKEKKP